MPTKVYKLSGHYIPIVLVANNKDVRNVSAIYLLRSKLKIGSNLKLLPDTNKNMWHNGLKIQEHLRDVSKVTYCTCTFLR
jgi:hypothetical protein